MTHRLLLVLAALLAVCAPVSAQDPSVLAGTVVVAASGAPVPDAIFRIAGTQVSAASDATGRFVLRGLPVGAHTLEVRHPEFGTHGVAVSVSRPGEQFEVAVRLSAAGMSIELLEATPDPASDVAEPSSPIPVRVTEATMAAPPPAHASRAGTLVERERIRELAGGSRNLADLLRRAVPALSERVYDAWAGDLMCLEFRGAQTRSMSATNSAGTCNHPLVFLDGVPLTEPSAAYGMTTFDAIEWIQAIPPNEAGAQFGGSAYGVILVTTATGARTAAPVAATLLANRRSTFDWNQDPQGHPFIQAFLGSAVGAGLGLLAAQEIWGRCVYVDDATGELERTCPRGEVVGRGAVSVAIPALASALGAHFGGRTSLSEGRWIPSVIGAAIALLPGYGFSLVTVGDGVETTNQAGKAFLVLGTPIVTALADRMYRRLR